jgi:hypothetical protein
MPRTLSDGHRLQHRAGFLPVKYPFRSAQSFTFLPRATNPHVNPFFDQIAL